MLLKEGQTFVIVNEDADSSSFVRGSEAMRSLGGGVKAKVFKNSSGKTIVESFHFDRDRFTREGAERWVEKHKKSILESVQKVQEAAPLGSFADVTMRAMRALNTWDYFNGRYCYIAHMFPDYCVVECGDELYKVPFKDSDGKIVFEEPKRVEMTFVLSESSKLNAELEEKSGRKEDLELSVDKTEVSVREADDSKREVVVVLIEAGTNYSKKRHYPKETIKEAAPLFAGLKMYIDHPTPTEEREKPERSVKDWVSTIEKSWYEDGKAMAVVKVHDDWLWSKLKEDKIFRDQIGISINASGKRHNKVIEGQNMEVIEEIVSPRSVDWVTEPGARGRVEHLVESQSRKEDVEMLKTVKLDEVKKERPDLVEAIESETREKLKGENESKIKEAVEKAISERAAKEREKAAKTEKVREKVKTLAEASKLPKRAIGTFVDRFVSLNPEIQEDAVEAAAKEAIESEVKYLSEAGAMPRIKVGVEGGKVEESASAPSEGFLKKIGAAEPEKK